MGKWLLIFGIFGIFSLVMFVIISTGMTKTEEDKRFENEEQMEYIKKWKEKHKRNK